MSELFKTPMEEFRNSVGFQINFILYSGLDVEDAINNICKRAEELLKSTPVDIPTGNLGIVFSIIEGARRNDVEKVKNYSLLLAEKLDEDDRPESAQRLRKLIEKGGGNVIIPMATENADKIEQLFNEIDERAQKLMLADNKVSGKHYAAMRLIFEEKFGRKWK